MIDHPNKNVVEFLQWVQNHYGVETKSLSSTWWGRLMQRCGFEMAGIQLKRSIYVNDVDIDGDGKHDYWRPEQPFACVALTAHELWHVLQKHREKNARWHYLFPQTMILAFLPWTILGCVFGSWLTAFISFAMVVLCALPGKAPHRLRQEAEAYAWNRLVVALMCENDPKVLRRFEDDRADVLSGLDYYFPTRDKEEAKRALRAHSNVVHTEPELFDTIAITVRKIREELN